MGTVRTCLKARADVNCNEESDADDDNGDAYKDSGQEEGNALCDEDEQSAVVEYAENEASVVDFDKG